MNEVIEIQALQDHHIWLRFKPGLCIRIRSENSKCKKIRHFGDRGVVPLL